MRIQREYSYFFVLLWVFCTGVRGEHLERPENSSDHLPTYPVISVSYDDLVEHHRSWSNFENQSLSAESVHPSAVLDLLRSLPEKETWRCHEGKVEHLLPVVRKLIRSWPKERRDKYEGQAEINGPVELEAGLKADRLDLVAEVAHRYPETTLEVIAITTLMKLYLSKYKFAHASVYARALLGFKKMQDLSTEDLRGVYLALQVTEGTENPQSANLTAIRKLLEDRNVPQEYFGQVKEIATKNAVSVTDMLFAELSSGDRHKRENALRLLRYATLPKPDCESFDLRGALVSADPMRVPFVLRGLGVLHMGNDSEEAKFVVKRFGIGVQDRALERLLHTVSDPEDRAVFIGFGFNSLSTMERDHALSAAAAYSASENFLPFASNLREAIWNPLLAPTSNRYAALIFSGLGPQAIPFFEEGLDAKLLPGQQNVRVASLEGLAQVPGVPDRIMDKAAVFLKSNDSALVFPTIKLLAKSKKHEKEALEKLLTLFAPNMEIHTRRQAVRILPKFHDIDKSLIEDIVELLKTYQGPGAYDFLIDIGIALGEFGKNASFAVPTLKSIIAEGAMMRLDPSFNALTGIEGFDEAIKHLEKRLEKESVQTLNFLLSEIAQDYRTRVVDSMLNSKNSDLRQKAIFAIANRTAMKPRTRLIPHAEELVALITNQKMEYWEKRTLFEVYISLETPEVFEKGLKHTDPKIRMAATQGLLRMDQEEKTLGKIIPLLDDKDDEVASHTVTLISSFGTSKSSVVPAMLKALDTRKGEVRSELVLGLTRLGKNNPAVIDKFIELIDDKDMDVRENAILSLGKMGKGALKALPRLRAISEKKDGAHTLIAAQIAINELTSPPQDSPSH